MSDKNFLIMFIAMNIILMIPNNWIRAILGTIYIVAHSSVWDKWNKS